MALRNTTVDWEGISGEPYHGVLVGEHHFRANMTPERRDAFFATGRQDIAWMLDVIRSHYGPFDPKSAIDFGCGVGRLTCPIAAIVDRAYGVDAASRMRDEARLNVPANAEIVDEIPDVKVDWINSVIVFQHIHPTNGIPLLAMLLGCLAPGGGITLQFGLFKERGAITMGGLGMDYVSWDGENMRTLIETPPGSGTMMMYDYDLNQIVAMLYAAGIEQFTIQHSNHGGHHGAFIIGRKLAV